jgi:hypothetical protein
MGHPKALAKGRMVSLKQMPLLKRGTWFKGSVFDVWLSWDIVGIVKKFSFWIILSEIPLLNSFTCFQMYCKKASLDHLPNNMILKTGTPARYIAMAEPLLAEWRPIWFVVKPRISGPIDVAVRNEVSWEVLILWTGVSCYLVIGRSLL